jgi:hypothetical protein
VANDTDPRRRLSRRRHTRRRHTDDALDVVLAAEERRAVVDELVAVVVDERERVVRAADRPLNPLVLKVELRGEWTRTTVRPRARQTRCGA